MRGASALAVLNAALIVGTAQAADLPVKAPPPPAAFSWTGYYVGATVGVGVSSDPTAWNWTNVFPTGSQVGVGGGALVALPAPLAYNAAFATRQSSVGIVGGLEAGANWQIGKMVYGVEADWSATSQRGSYSAQPVASIFPPFPQFFFPSGSVQGWTKSIDWLSTFRGRAGIADGPNLWFVTGGLAVGQVKTSLFSTPGSPGNATGAGARFGLPGGAADDTQIRVGWVVGGGVETAISRLLGWGPGWSAKIEYLYADLGNTHIDTPQVPLPTTAAAGPFVVGSTRFTSTTEDHILRVGLNYRFGAGPEPDRGYAANMYTKAPPPAFNWRGHYAGATVGMGVSSDPSAWNWTNVFPAGALVGVGGGPLVALPAPLAYNTAFATRQSSVGIVGGLEAGANWQTGKLVYGVEADWSATSQRGSYSAQPVASIFPPFPQFFFASGTVQGWTKSIDWLSTFRGRAGIADGPNLWFVTGGLAVGQVKTSLFSTPGSVGNATGFGARFGLPGGAADDTQIRIGWVVGGGVETAIGRLLGWGPGWSAKIEYLYADLGNTHIDTPQLPLPTAAAAGPFVVGSTRFTSTTEDHILRVGLNYRFTTN